MIGQMNEIARLWRGRMFPTFRQARPLIAVVAAIDLPARLNRPQKKTRRRGYLRGAVIAALLAVVSICILPTAEGQEAKGETARSAAAAAKQPDSQPGSSNTWGGPIDLLLVDRSTGQPIPDAEVEIVAYWDRSKDDWTQKADERGRCRITMPATSPRSMGIYPFKDGFVPLRIRWQGDPTGPGEARTFKVSMQPAVPIGGTVRNEQGEPIEGAVVCLFYLRDDPQAGADARINVWLRKVETGKDGRWRCNFMPPEFEDARIFLSHGDYLSDNWSGGIPMPVVPTPGAKSLLNMTAVMVMKKGITLSGTVTDMDGKPIAGAKVTAGTDSSILPYRPAKTDEKGQYRFSHVKPGRLALTVTAKGYSPESSDVVVAAGIEPIGFRLGPAKTIRGRVVDSRGKGVSGAYVYADTWRGRRRGIRWNTKTDEEGRFRWDGAPADGLSIRVSKQGYMAVTGRAVQPSDTEHVIRLPPELRIRGSVVDADTGKAIEQFTMVPGISWDAADLERRPPHWQRRGSKPCSNGRYEATFTHPYPGLLVRIEAEGYRPGVSRVFDPDEGEQSFDFKLQKGTGLAGVVSVPDGGPAAGATVVLASPGQTAYIQDARRIHDQGNPVCETGPDGRYTFGVQEAKWRLVVLHDAGYAELDHAQYEKSPNVTLRPWGRVEGRLLFGTKGAPQQRISVQYEYDVPSGRGEPRVFHDIKTTTDATGRFVFNRVPPGEVRIVQYVEAGGNIWTSGQSEKARIEPGKTLRVVLGGKGRPVVGRVVWPGGAAQASLAATQAGFSTKIDSSLRPPLPENWAQMDNDARARWYEKWKASDEAEALRKAREQAPKNRKYFSLGLGEDGRFRVEDVPAGAYHLSLVVYEGGGPGRGQAVASLTHDFIVPEMPGGRSDEPLDLGLLELDLAARQPGRTEYVAASAPPAEARSLLGKPLPALAAFGLEQAGQQAAGKRVLVCFWEMTQRPSRHCIQTLATMADDLAAKAVTVVSVHASPVDEAELAAWLKQSKIRLPAGRVPTEGAAAALATWAVKGRPWLILTDEKHVVRAEGFGITELADKLGQLGVEAAVPAVAPAPVSTRPRPEPETPEPVEPAGQEAPAAKLPATALPAAAAWVLHNEDPDFRKPPFEDTLTALSESGKVVARFGDFNICQTVGGHRAIASAEGGKAVVVCENVARRISKRRIDGEVIFSLPLRPGAVDVLDDGSIFALTASGTISGAGIVRISPTGEILARGSANGFDLVADEKRRALYLVGDDIKYVGFDLETKWSIDPIGWYAVSVDVCSDGSAWIAERGHPQVSESKRRLLHVSPEGKVLHTVEVSYSPSCLRVDRTDDSVYVISDRLYKYDKAGKLVFDVYVGIDPASSLDINVNRNVWIGTRADVRQFTAQGKFIRRIEEFPRRDQKYVVCPPRPSGQ